MLTQEQRDFLGRFGAKAATADEFEAREQHKQLVLDTTLGAISDEEKAAMRAAMNFHATDAKGNKVLAMDPRGQEYSLDPESMVKKGLVVDPASLKAARQQLEKLLARIDTMRAAKMPDGSPAFSPDDIVEAFESFVREGLLPESLITDANSKVAKLLGGAFTAYKKSLEEAKQERQRQRAKTEADWQGAGSKLDVVKAGAAKMGEWMDEMKTKVVGKSGTREERLRRFDLAKTGVTSAIAIYGGYSAVEALKDGSAIDDAKKTLAGVEEAIQPSTVASLLAGKLVNLFAKDPETASALARYAAAAINEAGHAIDEGIDLFNEVMDLPGVKIALATESLLQEGGSSAVEVASPGLELMTIKGELTKAANASEIRRGAATLANRIDLVVQQQLTTVHANAGAAIGGAYLRSVRVGVLVEAVAEEPADCQALIDELAKGFVACFRMANSADATFERVGKAVAKAFQAKANAAALGKAIEESAGEAFASLLPIARRAIVDGLGLQPDAAPDDPTAAAALRGKLADPVAVAAMVQAVARGSAGDAAAEMQQAEDELAEYERQLVLVDEATEGLAEQRSVERLIAQLKQDRAVIELVAGLAGGLASLGAGSVELAGKATEKLGEVLVGEIAGPLKAAKLIAQMSVSVIKGVERWRLWSKVKKSLDLASRAKSALSSTIQGFVDSKQEQFVLGVMETALLAVQTAGAVLGSIPEPITMAVGKTLSAVGSAGAATQQIAGMIYNEAKLREGWRITKEAIANPRDRALGLAALRLNGTLGMHAIAWAALERRDPIARELAQRLGLDERTLSDGGTTQAKVRKYLETLLNEDRKFLDTEQVTTNWQPKNLTLSTRSWLLCVERGQRVASPKLRPTGTADVEAKMRIVGEQALGDLTNQARLGRLDGAQLQQHLAEVRDFVAACNGYKPIAEDGSAHTEMAAVVDQFLALASDRRLQLERLVAENATAAQAAVQAQALAAAQATRPGGGRVEGAQVGQEQ